MRTKSIVVSAIAIVLGIVMLFPTSVIPSEAADVPTGGTLRIGWLQEPDTLNPFTAQTVQAGVMCQVLYDYLVKLNTTLEPVPGLALNWTTSTDSLTWTFNIVQNATWSDGTAVKASDVKFTYDFIKEQNLTMLLNYVKFMSSVTTSGDYTVVIVYSAPVANILSDLTSVPIVPEHIWTGMTKANVTLFTNDDPVGSGPFTLDSWTKGSTVVLNANKEYWGGAPYIDKAVFQQYANAETMVTALRNNEIDIIPKELPPTSVSVLSSDSNIKVATATDLYYRHICINMWEDGKGNPTLRDVNVRNALVMATDRQTLINIVHLGYNQPGSTIVMKGASYWWDPVSMFQFNISAANALLNASGYLDVDSDGIREAPGNASLELSYTLLVLSRWPEEMRTGQQLQTWWGQIGVDLTVQSTASNTILSIVFPDYSQDMYLWGFSGQPDPSFSVSIYMSNQVQNWNGAGYQNATYDDLYNQQVQTMDPEARRAILYEMQEMIYQASPSIVLYYMDAVGAYRLDKFTGFVNMPVGLISNVNPWTLRQVHLIYGESEEPVTPSGGTDYVPWLIAVAGIVVAVGAVSYLFMKKPKAPKTET